MIPNNTFSYLKQVRFAPDTISLIQCYQPIIGFPAFALYHYLCANNDGGVGRYRFSQILNHLNMGQQTLEQALDFLTAMDLLALYQEGEDYCLALKPALSQQDFLDHALYASLLSQKIGEHAVEQMRSSRPLEAQDISKSFSQVFQADGRPVLQKASSISFDKEAFQHMMVRNQLRFSDEDKDLIGLYHLAEQEKMDWMELYQLAKETALDQRVSIKRMQEKLKAKQQMPNRDGFSQEELALIRGSKSLSALDFLQALKESKKAAILSSERKCLHDLGQLGLLDEVINVMVLYTFNRLNSANLNEKYIMKLGNDFSHQEIRTAEEAVKYLRLSRSPKSSKNNAASSNIPEWSKQEVHTEPTPEGQAQLADLYRQFEEMENKGGGL